MTGMMGRCFRLGSALIDWDVVDRFRKHDGTQGGNNVNG